MSRGAWVLLAMVLLCGGGAPAWSERLSEEPYASGKVLSAKYQPLLKHLARQGIAASYVRTSSYEQYAAEARAQRLDLAFASAGLASLLIEQYGYEPLLALDQTLNASVIVYHKASEQSLAELDVRELMMPDRHDIVHELGTRLLQSAGLDVAKLPPANSAKVDLVILAVLAGTHRAGVVAGYDLELLSPAMRRQLRVLGQSQGITAHYALVRGGMPAARRQALVLALQQFANTPEGAAYADSFGSSRFLPVTAVQREEIRSFRALGERIGGVR